MPMALKVEVYQKEKVRPCSPTPVALRNYNLSLLDIVAGTYYNPCVAFYHSVACTPRHDYDELKESLSKTLSVLYPLAGRLKDGLLTIECNDEGVDFVGANVTNYSLAEFLRHPTIENIRLLLPLDPYPYPFDPALPMFAVQVTRFLCGGTAVGMCLWHSVADGVGLMGIYNTWAAFNRGEWPTNAGGLIVNATGIFRPGNLDTSQLFSSAHAERKKNQGKYTVRRFIFRKQDILRIRDDHNQSENQRRPSRVEALSAFVWAAVIRATLQANPNVKTHLLTKAVNLRNKLDPPFPSQCVGNINQVTLARWEAGKQDGTVTVTVTGRSLVRRVVEAIDKVTEEYVRKLHGEGGYLRALSAERSKAVYNKDEFKVLSITSLCKLSYPDLDFGWGKPAWTGPGHIFNDLAMFFDAKDEGIEVWIGLTHQVMSYLEKDMEFHAYVSFTQIGSEAPYHLSSAL